MPLRFVGIRSLGEDDKFTLRRISERAYPKILRHIPNAELVLIVKLYEKTGHRKKFSVHSKLNDPKMKFRSEAFGWDIAEATHSCLGKLQREIRKVYED